MVQALVKAEFLFDVAALRYATGNAKHAAALDQANLANDRADCAGGRGHDKGFACLRPPDVFKTGVSREARHAEHPQCIRNGARRWIDLLNSLAVRKGI